MMRVLITGATGFIGKHLVAALLSEGNEVTIVSRSREKASAEMPAGVNISEWETNELRASVKWADAIINLAGESISNYPWSRSRKRKIVNSRLLSARRLHEALAVLNNWKGVFIQASAVGYYGHHPKKECTELCSHGSGFMADVCSKWESQIPEILQLSGRVLTVRIGIVFGKDGGIFPELLKQSRRHLGGTLGSGNQYISWIHVYDLVYGILYLMNEEKAEGVFNLVAPKPIQQKELAAMISKESGHRFQLPAPAFFIRLLFGDFGKELLLGGQKVSPAKMIRQGFVYKYTTARQALEDMFDPYRK